MYGQTRQENRIFSFAASDGQVFRVEVLDLAAGLIRVFDADDVIVRPDKGNLVQMMAAAQTLGLFSEGESDFRGQIRDHTAAIRSSEDLLRGLHEQAVERINDLGAVDLEEAKEFAVDAFMAIALFGAGAVFGSIGLTPVALFTFASGVTYFQQARDGQRLEVLWRAAEASLAAALQGASAFGTPVQLPPGVPSIGDLIFWLEKVSDGQPLSADEFKALERAYAVSVPLINHALALADATKRADAQIGSDLDLSNFLGLADFLGRTSLGTPYALGQAVADNVETIISQEATAEQASESLSKVHEAASKLVGEGHYSPSNLILLHSIADAHTLYGTVEDDGIQGNELDDTMFAQAGTDIIFGHGGNDIIYTGTGSDIVIAGDQNDKIVVEFDTEDAKTVSGGSGYDWLYVIGSESEFDDTGSALVRTDGASVTYSQIEEIVFLEPDAGTSQARIDFQQRKINSGISTNVEERLESHSELSPLFTLSGQTVFNQPGPGYDRASGFVSISDGTLGFNLTSEIDAGEGNADAVSADVSFTEHIRAVVEEGYEFTGTIPFQVIVEFHDRSSFFSSLDARIEAGGGVRHEGPIVRLPSINAGSILQDGVTLDGNGFRVDLGSKGELLFDAFVHDYAAGNFSIRIGLEGYLGLFSNYILPEEDRAGRIDLSAKLRLIAPEGVQLFSASGLPGTRPFSEMGTNVITGSNASDTHNGTSQDDYIDGRAGNDILRGLAGQDVINGGAGDDRVAGGEGADQLRLGPGLDIVDGFLNELAGDEVEDLEIGESIVVKSGTVGSFWTATDGGATMLYLDAERDGVAEASMVLRDLAPGTEFRISAGGGDTNLELRKNQSAFTPSGDYNGDGTEDILWFNPYSLRIGQWEMNDGNSSWKQIGTGGAGWEIAGVGDFDVDGTDDLLWFNPQTLRVGQWEMSNGSSTWKHIGTGGAGWEIAGIGDFDGDGTDDLLWFNPQTLRVGQWEMSNGSSTWKHIGTGGAGWEIAGVGDLNGDGTDDVLWFNPQNLRVGQWEMNNGTSSWKHNGIGGAGWEIAGVGDFNGDSTDDTLWFNPNAFTVGQWEMDNGNADWAFIGKAAPGWKPEGTGDYDGNGTDDILWRNAQTGQVGQFEMNNGNSTWDHIGWGGPDWFIFA
ncbi:MAG: FG-GAP-like repeat-containing protein [Pseudomonadota bacterium]